MWNFICLLAIGFGVQTLHADAWDDVLKQAGLTKSQVHFDLLTMQQSGGGEFQSPFFTALHTEPLRIPYYARLLREAFLEYAGDPWTLSTSALARVGLAVRRTLEGDPLAALEAASKQPDALLSTLERLHKLGGQPLTKAQRTEVTKRARRLNSKAAEAVAFLLGAEAHALEWRARAFAKVDAKAMARAWAELTEPPKRDDFGDHNGLSAIQRRLLSDVDLQALMVGGLDLTQAVTRVRERLAALEGGDVFEWTTPLGLVVVRGGSESNTYAAGKSYLLIIDKSGNDTYFSGAGTTDATHPVSVLLDLSGDDQYLARPDIKAGADDERRAAAVAPAFAGAVLGYAVLVDAEGNDRYESYRQALGRGQYGFGLLWDLKGDDHYTCWVQCQGSAEFGLGLLIDGDGRDAYVATAQAQGFAGPRAAGVLTDAGRGADTFTGQDTAIDFPSQVDAKHNVSFVQGAACGVRADGTDGQGLAGGFAALVDGGGDNVFGAGFFAQGVSYWYGVGWLSLADGADRVSAGKYAQGAGVHFGVGVLQDTGGNDTYAVAQELGIGHGHDFGVGFFLEGGGDDTYTAPAFSLGCASAQGLGFFWDRAGNDTYVAKAQQTLGCAEMRIEGLSLRVASMTLGVFLDTDGRNQFTTDKPDRLDGGAWRSKLLVLPKDYRPAEREQFMRDHLIGVGRVAKAPGTPEPF